MNVELANVFFNIANLLFIVGSISLIKDFLKTPIKYKMCSVWMTFGGILSVEMGYIYLHNWLSVVLAVPTVVYWGVASIYSVYRSWKNGKT